MTWVFSPIHDHTGSNCWFKVCDGTLAEVQYEDHTREGEPPVERKTSVCHVGDVGYINGALWDVRRVCCDFTADNIGLHKVGAQNNQRAVSLHLYSPPSRFCHTFAEGCCNKSLRSICFHSKMGEVVHYGGES